MPVDVSEAALVGCARRILAAYPGLAVRAVVSDFEEHLGLPDGEGRRLVAFLGSTIGNLVPTQRAAFLAALRARLHDGDALLLGTDLVKDPAVLVAAYDDSAGVTAAFNKNILSVLNAGLDADFDPDGFEHVAVWDPVAEWIEMRLRSAFAQRVRLARIGMEVTFDTGEEMRTEVSAKFRRSGVAAELAAAGLPCGHGGAMQAAGSACRSRCPADRLALLAAAGGGGRAVQPAFDPPGPDAVEPQRAD